MKNVTQKIMEAFSNLIPEGEKKAVEDAINSFVTDTENNIKKEYEKTLEESYEDWRKQIDEVKAENEKKLQEAENTAVTGYEQAKQMIIELQEKLEVQKKEYEDHIEREFAEAKTMIDAEKAKNEEIENKLYEAYNNQLETIKSDLVNKLDEFMTGKVADLYESAKKELKNDPEILETQLAFNKIRDIISSSVTNDNGSAKNEALEDQISQLAAENKRLKAKTLRLETEATTAKGNVLTESNTNEDAKRREEIRKETERRIAEKNASVVEGRGNVVSKDDLITEKAAVNTVANDGKAIVEAVNMSKDELRKLAGITN